jgi:methylated-DNA-protein-cysteine methyltransferase related protein
MVLPVLEPRAVSPGWNARVYAVVRQCPAGFVTTYGQVATLLGSPRVARHVGFALAALVQARESDPPVPWHRVINAQGRISHRGDVRRASQQQRRLEREGVVFDARGRVDLRRFLYTYPNFHWPDDPVDPDGFASSPARAKAPRNAKAR